MTPVLLFAVATFSTCTPAPTPGNPTPADPGTVSLPAWTTAPVEVDRELGAIVVDLRTGTHDGYDRLVFEFDERVPGYRVEYLDGPASGCASGEEVPVEGGALLRVTLHPAAAHTEEGVPTLSFGSFTTSYDALLEGVSTCDWEGYVEWVAGTRGADGFRVFELSDPARLVVDFKH